MSLNANNQPKAKTKRVPQEEIKVGNYMARLVQVIDTGVQYKDVWDPASNSFKQDRSKPPVQHIMTTYELLTSFVKDEDGKENKDKPRWISEEWPLYSLDQDLATTTKRYNGIDPEQEKGGDWTALVGDPCQVAIVHKKSGKAKIGGVAAAIDGVPYPELKNEPKVYTIDQGKNEIFLSLPEWIQERIMGATNWAEDGEPQTPTAQEPEPQEPTPNVDFDDDVPY